MNTRAAASIPVPAFIRMVSHLSLIAVYLLTPVLALERWRRRQQASEQLASTDMRILRDAGISDAQRFIEVNRPF